MTSLSLTLRYALRSLRSAFGTSALAALVLALGIAGTTVTYSGVEAVVLRSLPFREPVRLVDIRQTTPKQRAGSIHGGTNSQTSFETVRAQSNVFEDVAGYVAQQPVVIWDGMPERVPAWQVSANFFSTLGVTPLIGRTFTADEDRLGAASSVVLSHAFWMSRFGGDPRVVGRTLTLDGAPAEIVGVMPRAATYPRETMLWRNLGTYTRERNARPQGGYWILGRLRPGVSIASAMAALDVSWAQLGASNQDYVNWVCNVTPLHTTLIDTAATPLWLLFGAGLLVLAIACANVANLLLVRAFARQQDVAVRVALGASRGHIAGQFVAEALILAAIGGIAGVVLAGWAAAWISTFARKAVPGLADVALNGNVLALSLGATLATGLIFGLVPGLWAARRGDVTSVSMSGGRAGITRWRSRIGDVSLVSQLAITVVLLGAAGLVIASVLRLTSVDTGYDATSVVAAHLTLPKERYASKDQMIAFADQVETRLRGRGEVVGAAVSTGIPFGAGAIGGITVDGVPAGERAPWATFTAVSSDYFGVLQIPLRAGRPLRMDGTDAGGILVNEALVRHYLRGQNPIGHRISFFGKSTEGVIVGVVADTHDMALTGEAWPHIYQPFNAAPATYFRVLVRARGDMTSAATAVRETLREVDPRLPIDKLQPLRELMMDSIVRWRLVMRLLAVFAGLALIMSAAGMYALMAHQVARRRQEMGIRVALGAARARIVRMVVGRSLVLTAIGLTIGIGGAIAAGRLLSAFLFQVTPYDPLVLGGVAIVLVATVLLACWLPARRAASIDPATLLRTE